jgi:hypothetical protein
MYCEYENAKKKLDALLGPAYESNPGRPLTGGPEDESNHGGWWRHDRKFEDEEYLQYFDYPSNQWLGVCYDPQTQKVWVDARLHESICPPLKVDFKALTMTVTDGTAAFSIALQPISGEEPKHLVHIATHQETDVKLLDLILEVFSRKLLSKPKRGRGELGQDEPDEEEGAAYKRVRVKKDFSKIYAQQSLEKMQTHYFNEVQAAIEELEEEIMQAVVEELEEEIMWICIELISPRDV